MPMRTAQKRVVIISAASLVILLAVLGRLYFLASQWERCAPSHDEIVEMWKRS